MLLSLTTSFSFFNSQLDFYWLKCSDAYLLYMEKYFENNDICFSLKLISNSRYSHSLNLILEQIKISSLSLTTHNLFWLLIRILNCPQWKITWGVFFLIVGKTLSCNLIIFLSIISGAGSIIANDPKFICWFFTFI